MFVQTGVAARPLRLLVLGVLGALLALAAVDLTMRGETASAQTPVETEPADGAELSSPPTEVVLRFEEPVGEAEVSMSCQAEGEDASDPFTAIENPPTISSDQLTVTAQLLEPPPVGECIVAWRTTLDTGEPGGDGSISFVLLGETATVDTTVPEGTTPPTPPAEVEVDEPEVIHDASEVSDGPIWLGQVLSTFAIAVLFGSCILIVAAWPEGPEYILAVRFLRSTWLLALVGTLLYIVALSAAVRDESFGNGLNPAGWLDLFDAGLAGQAALARLVLVVACAWVVLRPERVIEPTTQLPAIAIPTVATVTLGLTRTAGDLAVLGVIAGIAHALAMAIWVGGLVLLARVVLAGPGEEDLVHAVRGFGRISGPAIIVTVVSGLIQLYRLDGGSLFSEPHGRVLLLKTVLVAIMLFVGLTARQIAMARLARVPDLAPRMADRLRRAFGTEAVIGVIVVGLSGWLLALDPGKLPEPRERYPVEEQIVDETSGLDLTVSLRPGQVGTNDLRVEVDSPESQLSGLQLTFVPPPGTDAPTIVQPIPLTGEGIAVTPPGEGIPLDVAGAWTLQVSATTPTGSVTDASGTFDVRGADGALTTPSIGTQTEPPDVTPATTTTTIDPTATTAVPAPTNTAAG